MVTALANGASAIKPVEDIPEALALRQSDPQVLLAGERDGLRITASLTGGTEFDLGNSPREFTRAVVRGRKIAITTTNGTRALRACARAREVYAGCFLNLQATADGLEQLRPGNLLLVCSGTVEQSAYEDVLGAGALCDLIWPHYSQGKVSDSAGIARQLFLLERDRLAEAVASSRNGRRLLGRPELADDVAFCARRNAFELCARLDEAGWIKPGLV
jgi:2-phosphosulfolactate phosphatase